jgi:hypothetical protein
MCVRANNTLLLDMARTLKIRRPILGMSWPSTDGRKPKKKRQQALGLDLDLELIGEWVTIIVSNQIKLVISFPLELGQEAVNLALCDPRVI